MRVQSYRDLIVWQKAIGLAGEIYHLSKGIPADERYGITSQLRRAAVSVSSNIAEGNGRTTTRDYLRFLANARGSLYEIQSLLFVSKELEFVTDNDVQRVLQSTDEVGRLLSGLRSSLTRRLASNP